MIVQKSEWLACPPALLRTPVRMASGDDRLDRPVCPLVALEGLVRVVHVGLVVLVVVDLHRPRVDVGLQRAEVVGKRR